MPTQIIKQQAQVEARIAELERVLHRARTSTKRITLNPHNTMPSRPDKPPRPESENVAKRTKPVKPSKPAKPGKRR